MRNKFLGDEDEGVAILAAMGRGATYNYNPHHDEKGRFAKSDEENVRAVYMARLGRQPDEKELARDVALLRGIREQSKPAFAPTTPTAPAAPMKSTAAETIARLSKLSNESDYEKEDAEAIEKLRGLQKAGDFVAAGKWFDEYSYIRNARQDAVIKPLEKNAEPNNAGVMQTQFIGFDNELASHGGTDRPGIERTQNFIRNYIAPNVNFKDKSGRNVRYTQMNMDRAGYEQETNKIYAQHVEFPIMIHELGHCIESNNPKAHEAVTKFLHDRVGTEKATELGTIAKELSGEYGRQDNFAKLFDGDKRKAYYVGKVYGVDDFSSYRINHRELPNDPSQIGNTEILSMGMELMVRTPVKFAKTDPEYFTLVHDIMRGMYS